MALFLRYLLLLSTLNIATICHAYSNAINLKENPPSCDPDFFRQAKSAYCVWEQEHRLYRFVPSRRVHDIPVFYLSGGPGIYTEQYLPQMEKLSEQLGRIILFPALHGLYGESKEKFDCIAEEKQVFEYRSKASDIDEKTHQKLKRLVFLKGCIDRLSLQKAELLKYGTVAIADSYEKLRKSLGIRKWVIMAESYGTRPAIQLANLSPNTVTSLVLDSPETPWVDEFWHLETQFKNTIMKLDELCAPRKANCPNRRQKISKRIENIFHMLTNGNSGPHYITLKSFKSANKTTPYRLNDNDVLARVFNSFRHPSSVRYLPYTLSAQSLEVFLKRLSQDMTTEEQQRNLTSFGVQHYIRCTELPYWKWGERTPDKDDSFNFEILSRFKKALFERQTAICNRFGIEPRQTMTKPVLHPSLRVLILSGGLDPVTPSDIVMKAFEVFPNVTFYRYPQLGHVVNNQAECVVEDIKQYINTPYKDEISLTTKEQPTSNCREKDLRLQFYTPVTIR
ncbi:alpha/beta fold hydrolase [Kordiimonas sp. SCSIO 12610]|uniref:alpha/beta fold hydrolase n=1 Tax=Kordiimonas sp. SCSIO 12610 TaxID=2829597 RepID=UPI00210EAFE4|nr:alpha/beta fold hydrolase [Kordiimonas sp. SCSIO 12610]UTW53934.1 alpha/beta fold hydrolase [Kordiimonas sp. SCSIO 12610]